MRKPQVVPDEDHDVMYERVAAVDVATPATRARIAEPGRELLQCQVQMVTLESTSDYVRSEGA